MSKVKKKWVLPTPEKIGEEYNWLPIVKAGKTVPFGYEQDKDNPHILNPIPEQLELLEEAKKHLKQYSLRDVANWLSEATGRYISHVGLKYRLELERKRKQQASIQRYLAEKYKEALEEAEKLERETLGARTAKGTGTDKDS